MSKLRLLDIDPSMSDDRSHAPVSPFHVPPSPLQQVGQLTDVGRAYLARWMQVQASKRCTKCGGPLHESTMQAPQDGNLCVRCEPPVVNRFGCTLADLIEATRDQGVK